MAARIANELARVMIGGGVALAVGAGVYNNVLYNVEPGHRAIIFDQLRGGIQDEVKQEGTHFLIPFVQKPVFYDVRAQPQPISVVTPSKDLQNISLTLRILYRPVEDQLPQLYKKYNTDYAERVLPSIGNEVLKSVVAQYDASELITQRESVSLEVRESLNKRANRFGIVLEDISITHLTFGREFTAAVEMKQVAAQDAERARFVVEKAEQEKLANVILAEGDAKAGELISQALEEHGKGLIELRKIEASMDIAKTLSTSPRVAYLPAGKGLLMNLSV